MFGVDTQSAALIASLQTDLLQWGTLLIGVALVEYAYRRVTALVTSEDPEWADDPDGLSEAWEEEQQAQEFDWDQWDAEADWAHDQERERMKAQADLDHMEQSYLQDDEDRA